MAAEIPWDNIAAKYINSNYTLEQIAEEYSISLSTLKKKAAAGKWKDKRTKREKKRAKKCIEKVDDRIKKRVTNKIADSLASEASAVDKMLKIVHKALDDELQFNRHLVTMEYSNEDGKRKWVEEQTFDKMDLRNFNSLVSSLEKLESLHRSLIGLVTVWQQSAIEVNLERLAIERERLEIAKAKEIGVTDGHEVGVVMLPSVDLEEYHRQQEEFLQSVVKEGEADE